MSQTRKGSIAETITSTLVGLMLAFTLNRILYTQSTGHPLPVSANLWITFWMTVASLTRGYMLRRMFNGQHWRKLLIWCALVYAAALTRRSTKHGED